MKILKVLSILWCTVQASHCLCIDTGSSSTDGCLASVITATGKSIIVKPEINFDHLGGCRVDATATANHGTSSFTVMAPNTSLAIISLENDGHPRKYIINFTYTLTTDDDCPINRAVAVSLHQTITVNVVGPPMIHHTTDSPHTIECNANTNVNATWIRFEKNKDILGYCAPNEQVFDGGYKIYYPFGEISSAECILELKGIQVGVYTCTVMYPLAGKFTSEKNVTIELIATENEEKKVIIGLSCGVAILGASCIVIIIIIILYYVVKKGCCGQQQQQHQQGDEQPLQPAQNDQQPF